jgi:hypothetical protein
MRRPHIQIFEIDAVAAAERREIHKPHREADRLAVPLGDCAMELRSLTEQRVGDHRLGRFDLVRKLFVLGELADESENEPGFVWTHTADVERHRLQTATAALMCGCGS